MHFAYLDEFGHIGPYVSRSHATYNTSPVFGLGGLILPAQEVRGFSTWFFQRKCQLLDWELQRSRKHPAAWEKKGSALYTTRNIEKYPELQHFTNRFLNKIDKVGGRVFYVGMHKTADSEQHRSQQVYKAVLRESMKRLNQFCDEDCPSKSRMLMIMDQHQERDAFVTAASQAMFNRDHPQQHMIEPPVQVESHRYQTVQAADWICGLLGRLSSFWTDREAFAEFEWADRLFAQRIARLQVRSGVRQDRVR